ncbi:MAG: hydantoinase B/oxoprolinase family protein, partial [Verrucomicrobiota bacterium]
ANERMADAVRGVTLRKGHDPADHGLVAFGGAGGLHACDLAELLRITKIQFPAEAGLLSARGLERAAMERFAEEQVLLPWSAFRIRFEGVRDRLEEDASRDLMESGLEAKEIGAETRLELRYSGQESCLEMAAFGEAEVVPQFAEAYESAFGYVPEGREIEVVSIRVRAFEHVEARPVEVYDEGKGSVPEAEGHSRIHFGGSWADWPRYDRSRLTAGAFFEGPALVLDGHSTLTVNPGWRVSVGSAGSLILDRPSAAETSVTLPAAVERELFAQRFRNVVEVMGLQLRRTALSTNVKERLDFSCCLLDGRGRLIANAPHIPVHLGAMGLCVREVQARLDLEPGDVILTNHPGCGGSHLPDLTVITPVFLGDACVALVANRAHHAEIGGIRPGSMPPGALSLAEEGVVLSPFKVFARGEPRLAELEALLASGPYPSRSVDQNIADIRAQIAANRKGVELLLELFRRHGEASVLKHFEEILLQGRQAVEALAGGIPGKKVSEVLDDGVRIELEVRADEGSGLTVDFSGTSERHPGNLHATPAIVGSALMYVLRVLVGKDLPLNDGLLDPVRLVLPPCFLNPDFDRPASEAPAVVGGNVETSQRVVDALFGALGDVAQSQGTMNNLVFGNADCSYYETICGGAGGGPNFKGASAVHTHMTNTAITDAEVMESRYPVRVRRFSLRPGSGGAGQWEGGNGIIRELEFLVPLSISLITQRRLTAPSGAAGGAAGQPGRQSWIASGEFRELPPMATAEARPGDRLLIETPGGGGYGSRK